MPFEDFKLMLTHFKSDFNINSEYGDRDKHSYSTKSWIQILKSTYLCKFLYCVNLQKKSHKHVIITSGRYVL